MAPYSPNASDISASETVFGTCPSQRVELHTVKCLSLISGKHLRRRSAFLSVSLSVELPLIFFTLGGDSSFGGGKYFTVDFTGSFLKKGAKGGDLDFCLLARTSLD